jgi:hypothetical protein
MTAIPHTPTNPTAHTRPTSAASRPHRATRRAARILSAIPVAFLAFDAAIKFTHLQPVTDAMSQLGWPVALAAPIGALLLACVTLYVIPQTAPLGAILLTGYLGGAVATHVRVGNPLFSHILFPTYIAAMLWGGLLLRDPRVRALMTLPGTDA